MSSEKPAADILPLILIDFFPPYVDAALAKCGELVTDEMLQEISRADYGMEAAEHLAALLPIRDEVRLPAPLPWHPKEVLELVRWSQPAAGHAAEREHTMRAFCCAALLRAAADRESALYMSGEHETLIQLIESVLFLGRGLPEAAGSALTWRFPQLRGDDEGRPFFAFGLFALALMVRRDSLSTAEIDALVDFVECAEAAVRDPFGLCTPEMFSRSFLDETFHDLRHEAWRALAASLRTLCPHSERLAKFATRIETSPGRAKPRG